MDHPNAVIARRLWNALAEGNADALTEILSPGITWRANGRSSLSGEFIGVEAVLDYLASIGERADELVSQLEAIYVSDDGAVVTSRTFARREGKTLEMNNFARLRIEDGLIISVRTVPFDQATADEFWE